MKKRVVIFLVGMLFLISCASELDEPGVSEDIVGQATEVTKCSPLKTGKFSDPAGKLMIEPSEATLNNDGTATAVVKLAEDTAAEGDTYIIRKKAKFCDGKARWKDITLGGLAYTWKYKSGKKLKEGKSSDFLVSATKDVALQGEGTYAVIAQVCKVVEPTDRTKLLSKRVNDKCGDGKWTQVTFTAVKPKPDLVVEGVNVYDKDPADGGVVITEATSGDTVSLSAVVKNVGAGEDATSLKAQIRIKKDDVHVETKEFVLDSTPQKNGHSVRLHEAFVVSEPGRYCLDAAVDVDNAVVESDEGNNVVVGGCVTVTMPVVADSDGDGVADVNDNCANHANPGQENSYFEQSDNLYNIIPNSDFEASSEGTCPQDWQCTGAAAVASASNRGVDTDGRSCVVPSNIHGTRYARVGCDRSIGKMKSMAFNLPAGVKGLSFLRAGGADAPSGVAVRRLSDDAELCSSEKGQDSDSFFEDECSSTLADHIGESVYIEVTDDKSSGWGKTYVDRFELRDAQGQVIHADAAGDACDDSDGDGVLDEADNCPLTPNQNQNNAADCVTAEEPVAVAPASLNDGLIAYWTFNENSGYSARDFSCNGHELTLQSQNFGNPVSHWKEGKIGNALSLNGQNLYAYSMEQSDTFTISAWIKPNAPSGYVIFQQVIEYYSPPRKDRLTLYTTPPGYGSAGFLNVEVCKSGVGCDVITSSMQPPDTTNWIHVAITGKDGHLNFYIDGTAAGEGTTTKPLGTLPSWIIAQREGYAYANQDTYHGLIDDLIVYNRVLSQDDIRQLMVNPEGTQEEPQCDWAKEQSGVDHDLFSIWGTGNQDIFSVGDAKPTLHFDGSSWSTHNGVYDGKRSLWGTGPNDVYTVTRSGIIARYDGQFWEGFKNFGRPLWAIWGTGANNMFVFGNPDSQGKVISRWDGLFWTSPDVSADSNIIFSVWGSGSHIFASGAGGIILHSSDGGSTWEKQYIQIHGGDEGRVQDWVGVWGSSDQDVFAVGVYGTILHYDGTAWSVQYTHDKPLRAISGIGPRDVYAVGDRGTIIHYDGSIWSKQKSNVIYDILGISAVGSDIFAVGKYGTILRRT